MEKETCALCGQPVEIEGFTETDADGIKKFCCAGCLSIFQLLNEISETTTIKNTITNNEEIP
ncbi:MAG: metal-binding protein [Methylovulum sp.]|uniref:metal-binding protein n=1 Tax=Methylovulum sp. TaxID=1916980 RepID=UPI002615B83C|nr:metal-binding protein [Methylovulum sp.]MDD2722499.1 metal-binding protein [Methylovulum sp.]MDD5125720.1 metal-binding protein [Methylovulum sp.]